jgi:peptide/nickel transport system permease protein
VPTLFFVSVLIFSLQQLLPGDGAVALAGEDHDPVAVAAIRQKYHLDRPVPVQYAIWIGKVLRGDFGESMRNRIPVSQLIAAKLPVTVELAVCSMVIALVIGIPAGVIAAVHQGRPVAVAANVLALSGLSVPHFWLGIMLICCLRSISAGCRRRAISRRGKICGEISRRSPCPRSCSAPAWAAS